MPPSPDSSCAVALFDVMSMTHDKRCYVDVQHTSNTERNLCGSPQKSGLVGSCESEGDKA